MLLNLISSVLTTAGGSSADVPFTLLPLASDGSDNLLNVVSGSTAALPDGGGITIGWTSGGQTLAANLYSNSTGPAIVDPGYPHGGAWQGTVLSFSTQQYYDPSNPSVISCQTSSAPIAAGNVGENVLQVAPDYYYISLAGSVRDPTCNSYAPSAMVCQRWGPNNCSRTEAGAVWQPSVQAPSWTYTAGNNYSAGIQMALWAVNPLYVQLQSGATACYGLTVRIQFVCSPSTLRPYITSVLTASSQTAQQHCRSPRSTCSALRR